MKKLKHIMKGIKWGNILIVIVLIIMFILSIKYIKQINTEVSVEKCNWSDSECKMFEEHKNDMQKYLEK